MADRDDPMADIELTNVLPKDMVTCPNETKIGGEFRAWTGYGYLEWIGLRELLVAHGRYWVSDLERNKKKGYVLIGTQQTPLKLKGGGHLGPHFLYPDR